MSNNLLRETIDTSRLRVMVFCENPRYGVLLRRSLEMIGCSDIHVIANADDAVASIDSLLPRVVFIVSDVNDPAKLESAQRINKKRAATLRRTPKILALLSPGPDAIMAAKTAGFFDVLPLPATPAVLFDRLETVLTRMD